MLRPLLFAAISIHITSEILELLRQTSRRFAEKRAKSYWKTGGEDRISELPDDLLVNILMFVPTTKDVAATMSLSKRWRFVWKMVPQLVFKDIDYGTRKRFRGGLFGRSDQRSIGQFLHKTFQLHKAPVLQKLVIELGPSCPIDVDVGNIIASAVERRVRVLSFGLMWSAAPTTLPKSLYTCDTLYKLPLSDKIVLDVPSSAFLPSLQHLNLYSVVYKDEDSHAKFLSSCPILKYLRVERHHRDNEIGVQNGSLVIDSPALKKIFIRDFSGGSCSIKNKPRFSEATIHLDRYPDEKFMRCFSSVMYLELLLGIPKAFCCKIIRQNELDWLEPLMLLLQNSPNLNLLFILDLYHKAL